ncbi:hypothetical protein QZH41_005306 [Actinostola sp. cb2023]|nr:hypothetical protein QZH41_005306 [Actinostola sp. cb2023]
MMMMMPDEPNKSLFHPSPHRNRKKKTGRERGMRRNYLKTHSLWSVVNNAGIARIGPVEWISLEDFKDCADVNLWGMIDVTKTFLPLLKMTKGRVVNVISIAGRVSLPSIVAYSVSKYGAEAFCDALRRELAVFGIQIAE